MTVAVTQNGQFAHTQRYKITWTADGSGTITLPDQPIGGIVFQSDGNDGGGTLTWLASVNESDFVAIGVNTAADPVSQTAVASATASGGWIFPVSTLGWRAIRFTLAGSTNPTLTVDICITYRR